MSLRSSIPLSSCHSSAWNTHFWHFCLNVCISVWMWLCAVCVVITSDRAACQRRKSGDHRLNSTDGWSKSVCVHALMVRQRPAKCWTCNIDRKTSWLVLIWAQMITYFLSKLSSAQTWSCSLHWHLKIYEHVDCMQRLKIHLSMQKPRNSSSNCCVLERRTTQ